ncbi:polyprotein [Lettuce necrotic leaf curl virus]|uniref:Polyprotein n=1 Tax=Lettuce necrotic leaf curl virus TaxID=1358807 RepID=S5MGH5_9SECO|nr:polyprotein [Lettuce necrotic leaf curl virus]AGR55592.1 polyprotein [Lettuce necrotic leaf curl virus]
MSLAKAGKRTRRAPPTNPQITMPSSSRGLGMGTSTNSHSTQHLSAQVQEFFDAVNNVSNANKKNGMGCFTIVRADSAEPVAALLAEERAKQSVMEKWNVLKSYVTSNADAYNQYFHLHGVIFIMVPHVMDTDPGEVQIDLFSGNTPYTPIDTHTFKLGDGPAVAIMNSPFCVPIIPKMTPFYYVVRCKGSEALVPCSVMAMWKQDITTKVAAYHQDTGISWALERLNHPKLVKSSEAAAKLISNYYSSGNLQNDKTPEAFLGLSKSTKHMDVGALLHNEEQNKRAATREIAKVVSKRHPDLYVPAGPCILHSDPDEEDDGLSLRSANVHTNLRAQTGGRHDNALFNVAMGFCGRQHDETMYGEGLLAKNPWMIEAANLQRCLDGKVVPFEVDDDDYHEVGVFTKWEHFVYLVLKEEEDPDDLRSEYPDEFEKFKNIVDATMPHEMEVVQGMLERIVDRARRAADVVVGCDAGNCTCETFFFEVEDPTPVECPLEAQAGNVTLHDQANDVTKGNTFLTTISHDEEAEDIFLDASSELFDFTSSVVDMPFKELEVAQPAMVQSNAFFEVGVFEFTWSASNEHCEQLLEIPLPDAFNKKNTYHPAGVELIRFFDAGIMEFSAEVNLSASFAVTGKLVLVWDEGDVLGARKDNINQASLLTTGFMLVGATQATTAQLTFKPTGIGKFVPFDSEITSSKLGSLRLYVLYPIICADPTTTFPGHVHLRARMISTNIMQPPRIKAQMAGGMPIGQAQMEEIPCSQIIASSIWPSSSVMGESFVFTFSPASVFEQDGILQPSLLCNLFRNCRWWTGECEFELHFDKSVFHSGSLGIGFGSIASEFKTAGDIYNTTHVIANLGDHDTFRFSLSMNAWNGKNLFSTGRKSSLPKLEHRANMRIFITVIKPLVTTNQALPSVNFYLRLRRIKNLVLGGSTPIRPVFGHWKQGKSGTDFFYSESDGPQADLLAELLKKNLPAVIKPRGLGEPKVQKKTELEAQLTMRQKLQGSVRQYLVPAIDDEKRYLVIPVAPWSYNFKDRSVVASEVNPLIDICSSFLYWSGSIRYTLIFHRRQSSANIGGIVTVCYEASGYPIEPGLHAGKQPISSGGGRHWNLVLGPDKLVHSFVVQDDKWFQRRYTLYKRFDDTKSRNDTLDDRLGNLVIYLPSSKVVLQVEIQISLGDDFQFSHARVPTSASEKVVGDMTSHIYRLDRDHFNPVEGTAGVLASSKNP